MTKIEIVDIDVGEVYPVGSPTKGGGMEYMKHEEFFLKHIREARERFEVNQAKIIRKLGERTHEEIAEVMSHLQRIGTLLKYATYEKDKLYLNFVVPTQESVKTMHRLVLPQTFNRDFNLELVKLREQDQYKIHDVYTNPADIAGIRFAGEVLGKVAVRRVFQSGREVFFQSEFEIPLGNTPYVLELLSKCLMVPMMSLLYRFLPNQETQSGKFDVVAVEPELPQCFYYLSDKLNLMGFLREENEDGVR